MLGSAYVLITSRCEDMAEGLYSEMMTHVCLWDLRDGKIGCLSCKACTRHVCACVCVCVCVYVMMAPPEIV